MLPAHKFLQHDRHLLLLHLAVYGVEVMLGLVGEYGCVNQLYSLGELLELHLVVFVVRHDVSIEHSGERLRERVFRQAGRTYGKRLLRLSEESRQFCPYRFGDSRLNEPLTYLHVSVPLGQKLIKVVLLHEIVELVGADDYSLRHTDVYVVGEFAEVGVINKDVYKRQSTSLSTERATGHADDVALRHHIDVVEIQYLASVPFLGILVEKVEQFVSVFIDRGEVGVKQRIHPLRQLNLTTRHEPERELVFVGVHLDGLLRYVFQYGQELLERARHRYRLAIGRIAEHEVTESQLTYKESLKIVEKRGRFLVDECDAKVFRHVLVLRVG